MVFVWQNGPNVNIFLLNSLTQQTLVEVNFMLEFEKVNVVVGNMRKKAWRDSNLCDIKQCMVAYGAKY